VIESRARVVPAATRMEWAAVVLFLILVTIVEPWGDVPAGVTTPLVVGQVVRFLCWIAVLPATFAALDRLPLTRGVFLRNLSLTVGVAAVVGVVRGLMATTVARLAAHVIPGMSVDLVGATALSTETSRAAGQFLVFLFVPHFVLQRLHSRRLHQRQVAETEARALSVELQPHFLFNTLNAIAALVRADPRTAESMLVKLSDLLRLTLDGTAGGESSLGDEIERLDLYVALQQMRFGPRLTVTTTVPDDIRGAGVPSMLLQPLVENALTHGIGPKVGPGAITITGNREGDRLVLSVLDDGVGLPPDARSRERIGVGNTRARLATLFPGDHRFELAPVESGGARATIDLPFRPASHVARADR
jgi:two-component system, LytTR family, sensor kinase